MSDGWIEIVEGGELPEMMNPVLVGGQGMYAVAYRMPMLDSAGNFGGWAWFEELTDSEVEGEGMVPEWWREIPK